MSTVLQTITAIALLIGACSSVAYAILAFRREKKKDTVWETAVKIMEKGNSSWGSARDFAEIYLALKAFHDYPEKVPGRIEVMFREDCRE